MPEYNEITTIQYLGSKSRLLSAICPTFESMKGVDTIVDLFAGSGTIGYAEKGRYHLIANDLEYYSFVINEAILNGCLFSDKEISNFLGECEAQYDKLSIRIEKLLAHENLFFTGNLGFSDYIQFVENTPSVFSPTSSLSAFDELLHIVERVVPGSRDQELEDPSLFLSYYANTYFGVRQCCQIDSICSAIFSITNNRVRNVLLTALMAAMSEIASTTTHFAQFLKVKNQTTYNQIIEKRKIDLYARFQSYLSLYKSRGLFNQTASTAACYNMDYKQCLESIDLDDRTLVYADPPYFKEHYSRYYHILNTVCLYDYPNLDINPQSKVYSIGRYRIGRNVSDFGKKAAALQAFIRMISLCASRGARLIISYSDNSIVNIADLLKAAKTYYSCSVSKVQLSHSKQGRSSVAKVEEYIIRCDFKGSDKDDNKRVISSVIPSMDTPGNLIHNYMARKPYNIVSALISQFSKAGDVIFDPMFGSGTTIIEASKLNRGAIGSDINPVGYSICKASLGNYNLGIISKDISEFVSSINERCLHLYQVHDGKECRIIERCHFSYNGDEYIPTEYWYKVLLENGKYSPRKKSIVNDAFIEEYFALGEIPIVNICDAPLIANSRIAIKKGATIFDYFCKRNLHALDIVFERLNLLKQEHSYSYDIIELLVSSAVNLIKFSDKKASSQMPYWLPDEYCTSRNALFVLEEKATELIKSLSFLQSSTQIKIGDGNCIENRISIYNKPAQKLTNQELPDNSVNLVITDPPYSNQAPYLEYSQMWNQLFGRNDEAMFQDELVVSDAPSRKKDETDFYTTLTEIICRTARSIKEGGYLVLFYHSFNIQDWSHLLSSAAECGLSYYQQIPTKAPKKSFKAIMSPKKTLEGNYILILKKEPRDMPIFNGGIDDARKAAISCVKDILRISGSATLQEIYDNGLLEDSIERNYLSILAEKYKSFEKVIKCEQFVVDNGIWRNK